MIKKITYLDFGFMPPSMNLSDGMTGESVDAAVHNIVRKPYFRVGWMNDNMLYLSFYTCENFVKVLDDTECLSMLDLLNREVEIKYNEELKVMEIVKFIK